MSYYTLPLQLSKITTKERHPTCDIHTSISQYIRLIVSCQYKENKYDDLFGNMIWENEFENIIKNNSQKEKIKNSLLETVMKYEKRLEHGRAEIQMMQEEVFASNGRQVREKVRIDITATVKKTKEIFTHSETFFIAPLSYY